MFYKHGLHPPVDIIETVSFLVALTFGRARPAIGFLARSGARHFEREGLVKVLGIKVPIELPPVGIITMRGRISTPSSEQLIECLRRAAKAALQ